MKNNSLPLHFATLSAMGRLSGFCLSLCLLLSAPFLQAQPMTYAIPPYSTGFENGTLDANWYTTASSPDGRVQVFQTGVLTWSSQTANSHTGNYFLGMDNEIGGTFITTEAWMGLNLAQSSNMQLKFWWAEWNDETHAEDGVYFSDNGGSTFTKVLDLNGEAYPDLSWNYFELDLGLLAAQHGLSLTSTFVVKFQQHDNFYFAGGNDGFLFDDIEVVPNTLRYVKQDGTGSGTSWTDASGDLQAMINDLDVEEVWVAAGTYKPSAYPTGCIGCSTPRDYTFQLKDGVSVYGGFAGTETSLSQRDWRNNITILSGDFNDDDVVTGNGSTLSIAGNSENAHHVVFAEFTDVTPTAHLDGFTVRGGNSNGISSISVNMVSISRASGGGIYISRGTNTLTNNILSGNSATFGGGIYIFLGANNLTNNILLWNRAFNGGGGISTVSGTNILTNNSLSGNSASSIGGGVFTVSGTNTLMNNSLSANSAEFGGGIYASEGTNMLTNNIVWGNSSGIESEDSDLTINYSIVQGGFSGEGNLDVDPLFSNPLEGDLRLTALSPAIDSGTATGAPANDLDGFPRPIGAGYDMGAYEYQVEPTPVVAVCQPLIVEAGANCQSEVAASAFDGGSTGPDMDMLTFLISPAGPYSLGTTNVILTVTDENNASSTCATTITVEDNTLPLVNCQEFSANFSACPDNIFSNSPSGTFFPIGDLSDFLVVAGGDKVASFDLSTCVSDNCSGEGFQSAFVDSYEENRVVGCSVDIINVVVIRDAVGNQAADSIFFRSTITFDGDPPVITCPADELIECGVIPTVAATDASSTSGCGTPTITVSDAMINGEPDIAGTTYTFTYTATDACGQTATCEQMFTVIDMTPPTIACSNQTINFNGETSIPLNPNDLVVAEDNCGVQDIALSPGSISNNQVSQTVPVIVTVTDINGNSATCTSQITVSGLPPGWSQNENGVGCANGNEINYNAGSATWTATSTNCYYAAPFNSDAMAFAQYTICGNGSITAQVTGITGNALGWAGVVMRESNAEGAKKAQLMTNMSNFSRREFRTTTGGASFPQQFPSQNRRWLRLVRSGNQFAMYVSANGVNWAFAGAQNIQMAGCAEVGLVATNYQSNSTVTATFANVSVTDNNPIPLVNAGDGYSPVNTNDIQTPGDFKVFPNPTSGELNVALSGYVGLPVSMEIYSTMGQLLFIREIEEVLNTDEVIDLSSFANGLYLIRITSAGIPTGMKRVTLAR